MPRYFFDTDDGEARFRDEDGLEFSDDQAARDEASRALAELALQYVPSDVPQRNLTMWVRREDGEPLLQLAMTFAVTALAREG
jgi:hypothetical protein